MLKFTSNIIGQMTRDCNLKCKYCFEGHDKKWKGKFMSVEQFKQIFDTVLYHRCILGRMENDILWHFHGGEVLMLPWEDLKQMIDHIEKRKKIFPNINWGIQTNGTLITEDIARFFGKNGHTIGTSFDGFNVEDRMSKKANIEFIEKLENYHKEFGTKFGVLSVFSRKNMKDWVKDSRRVLEFAEMVGVNLICPNETNKDIVPSAKEILKYWIIPVLKSFTTDNPIKERDVMNSMSAIITSIVFNYDVPIRAKSGCFDRICGMYTNMTSVNPFLKLHPCDKYMESGKCIGCRTEMDYNQRDFLGLHTAKLAVNHYAKMFKIENELGCDSCPARLGCPGDCQSYNISMNGEAKIDKKMCEVYKKEYEYINKHLLDILLHNSISVINTVKNISASFQDRVNKAGLKIKFDKFNSTLRLEEKNDKTKM